MDHAGLDHCDPAAHVADAGGRVAVDQDPIGVLAYGD
jgi:hypothetical protein